MNQKEKIEAFLNRKVRGLPNWLPLFFHKVFNRLFSIKKSKDDPNKCEIVFGVIDELPKEFE